MSPEWTEKMRELIDDGFLTDSDLEAVAKQRLNNEELYRLLQSDPLLQGMLFNQEGKAQAISEEFVFSRLLSAVLGERKSKTKMFLEQTEDDVRKMLAEADITPHISTLLYARSREVFPALPEYGGKILPQYRDTTRTSIHQLSTSLMLIPLARGLKLGEELIRDLVLGMINHDDGKWLLPHEIVNKPGELDEYEWQIMKMHPEIGNAIVQKSWPGMPEAGKNVILYHHERMDGSGYPYGLSGHSIPDEAQIAAVIDAYDALTEPRPYPRENSRESFSNSEALDMLLIQAQKGKLNREIVDCLVAINRESRTHPSKGGLYVKGHSSVFSEAPLEPKEKRGYRH